MEVHIGNISVFFSVDYHEHFWFVTLVVCWNSGKTFKQIMGTPAVVRTIDKWSVLCSYLLLLTCTGILCWQNIPLTKWFFGIVQCTSRAKRAFLVRHQNTGKTDKWDGWEKSTLSPRQTSAIPLTQFVYRFEKLDITPRSAQKIKPVLERWMKEAEERYENGGQNLAEFVGCEPNKKRKRRTSFTPQALEILNTHFEKNTHPSGELKPTTKGICIGIRCMK